MKKVLFIAFMAVTVAMVSCQNTAHSQGMTKQTISVEEFDQKLSAATNVQLIDVRTPEEYTSGHLKNALNADFRSDSFEGQLGKLDKTKPVLVYCHSGRRSASAASKMQDMGFTQVYDMDGGIPNWSNKGKPLDKGAAAEK